MPVAKKRNKQRLVEPPPPKPEKEKKRPVKPMRVVIRLVSSRGTDCTVCYDFTGPLDAKALKEWVEEWADAYVANTAVDSYTVHWRKVRRLPRAQLLKQHEKICKAYYKIKQRKEDVAAQLNPMKREPYH